MSIFEVIMVLLGFGTFLIATLRLVIAMIKNQKRKSPFNDVQIGGLLTR